MKSKEYYLVNTIMKTVINLCLDVCVHLHLATCHQGCSLHRYKDLVNEERKKEKFIISGWTMGLLLDPTSNNKDELVHFFTRGCPSYSVRHRHRMNWFAYVTDNK